MFNVNPIKALACLLSKFNPPNNGFQMKSSWNLLEQYRGAFETKCAGIYQLKTWCKRLCEDLNTSWEFCSSPAQKLSARFGFLSINQNFLSRFPTRGSWSLQDVRLLLKLIKLLRFQCPGVLLSSSSRWRLMYENVDLIFFKWP